MARLAVVPDLESELDRLYELPLDAFTPARNELAARLKKAGQDDAGARVKALRKPSVAVWTVNQLARRHGGEVAELIDAGKRLRTAQETALRGGGADDVRSSTRAERDALRKLTRLAEAVLTHAGRPASPQTLERVSSTLRAAAVDPRASELVSAEEVQAPGFAAVAEIAPRAGAQARRRKPRTDAAAKREHDQRMRRLRRDAETAERAAAAAEAEAEKAADDAAAARERAKQARRDARAATKALDAEERR